MATIIQNKIQDKTCCDYALENEDYKCKACYQCSEIIKLKDKIFSLELALAKEHEEKEKLINEIKEMCNIFLKSVNVLDNILEHFKKFRN